MSRIAVFDLPRAGGRWQAPLDAAFRRFAARAARRGERLLVHPDRLSMAPGAEPLDDVGPDGEEAIRVTEAILASLATVLEPCAITADELHALRYKLTGYNAQLFVAVWAALWARDLRSLGEPVRFFPSPTMRCQFAMLLRGGLAGRLGALPGALRAWRYAHGRRYEAHEIRFAEPGPLHAGGGGAVRNDGTGEPAAPPLSPRGRGDEPEPPSSPPASGGKECTAAEPGPLHAGGGGAVRNDDTGEPAAPPLSPRGRGDEPEPPSSPPASGGKECTTAAPGPLHAGGGPGQAVARADVLLAASMHNYLTPLVPLVGALAGEGLSSAVLLPREAEDWPNRRALPGDTPVAFFEDLARADDLSAAERRTREVRRALRGAGPALRRALATTLPVSLWPAVGPALSRTLTETLPGLTALRRVVARALDESRPRLVLAARLRRAVERILFAEAAARGIPTGLVIHGHLTDAPLLRYDAGSFGEATLVFAWNEAQAAAIRAHDPAANVCVTGNPSWQSLRGRQTDRETAAQLGLRVGEKAVVIATNKSIPPLLDWILEGVSAGAPGQRVVVKVHPGEDPGPYRAAVGAREGFVVVHRTPPLGDLLPLASVVVTGNSSSNLDALAAGVPVVIVTSGEGSFSFGQVQHLDFAAHGVPVARDAATLADCLRAVAGGEVTVPAALVPWPEGGPATAVARECRRLIEERLG